MRGFLYRAFRESYGIAFTVAIIVMTATVTHWRVMRASPWLFLLLAVLQSILCLILEKTNKLWNCIACHVTYNATIAGAFITGHG